MQMQRLSLVPADKRMLYMAHKIGTLDYNHMQSSNEATELLSL